LFVVVFSHPDKNPDPEVVEKFRDVATAYEVKEIQNNDKQVCLSHCFQQIYMYIQLYYISNVQFSNNNIEHI
jgi:hypothetical protein